MLPSEPPAADLPPSPTGGAGAGIAEVVADAVAVAGGARTRLMDIVQAAQQRLGHLSEETMGAIAERLGIPPVEVADMVSFYAFLNRTPKGRYHIRLSRSPVSLLKGAGEVAAAFRQVLGIAMGETSADGDFTLEWTNDIGMADQEPSALINGTVLTQLAPGDAATIVGRLRAHHAPNALPLFPGTGVAGSGLPHAQIRPSLVAPGAVLFREEPPLPGAGIRAALALEPDDVVRQISAARLRGRGGAGFPTGLKWKLCRQSPAEGRYVICNADEGEPGTFKDRVLLSEMPHLMFDGMTIAGYALGAREGVVYLRGEYAYLWDSLHKALRARYAQGLAGKDILGRAGFDFDIRIQLGAGAYICGEESALVESLEGKRGSPRDRPPFPTIRGHLQQPTAVDNVETFACAARILEDGPEAFARLGTAESTGTKLLSVSGDCPRPGVYEVPFGLTVNALLDLVGAPEAAFVQMGGPSGQCVAPKDYGRRIAFEDLPTGGSVMVFAPGRDVLAVVREFADFFAGESCGWCTPCRVGTTLLKDELDKLLSDRATLADIRALEGLAQTIARTSRCGLGQTAPNPILSTMRNLPEAYEARLRPDPFLPWVSLNEALKPAIAIQGREPVPEDQA